jgi:hypothetical protein
MLKRKKTQFLVVYENIWHQKDVWKSELGELGNTLKKIVKDYELVNVDEYDLDKYNGKDPYDTLSFSKGFYDLQFDNVDGEFEGRIMIFEI